MNDDNSLQEDGLPSHIPERREPIALCCPCFAQARCGHPCPPVRRMRLTPGASGENVVFSTVRRVTGESALSTTVLTFMNSR